MIYPTSSGTTQWLFFTVVLKKNEKNLYYHCYIRGFTAHYCTRQGGLPNAVSEFYNLTHRRRGEFTFTQGSVDREGLCFTFNR